MRSVYAPVASSNDKSDEELTLNSIRQSNYTVDGGSSWSYRLFAQAAGVSSAMLRMERLARPGRTVAR